MAIGTDSAIHFFGTQDYVNVGGATSTTSTVIDDAFSAAADTVDWTNDDDAPMASVVAMFDYATTPTVGTSINLYAQLKDIDGTDDQDEPTANFQHAYLGSFPVKNVTTNQRMAIEVSLPNTTTSQIYRFFIENKTGQTIQANWDMRITPKTIGPHA